MEKNKQNYVADKNSFFYLLNKALKPAYPSEDKKAESQTSDDYNDTRTRRHKVAGAED